LSVGISIVALACPKGRYGVGWGRAQKLEVKSQNHSSKVKTWVQLLKYSILGKNPGYCGNKESASRIWYTICNKVFTLIY